jgi:flagellar M-ring protein FliF
MLEIAKINGQIRAETVDQVGNMVAANPQETVAVLRGWLHEK